MPNIALIVAIVLWILSVAWAVYFRELSAMLLAVWAASFLYIFSGVIGR